MGQRDAVLTHFPRYYERFVVLLAVEKAFDIADELELHLIVEDHIVPLATLDVLPKLAILPPVPSVIHPYLFLDLRQMLSGGRDKLIHRLGSAIYDIPLVSWIEYVMIFHLRILSLPIVRTVHLEVLIFPTIVVSPKLHFVFQTSGTLRVLSGRFIGP